MSIQFNSQRKTTYSSPITSLEPLNLKTAPMAQIATPKDRSITLRATNQQKIEFSYSPSERTVSARIILSKNRSAPISPENLPKELRSIPNADAFIEFISHQSAHITRSGGENKVHLHTRGLGGNPYEQALGNFRSHLSEIINPYLQKDIVQRLDQISTQSDLSPNTEIINQFADLALPNDTRISLGYLSKQIRSLLNEKFDGSDIDAVLQAKESIRKDLSQFSDMGKEEPKLAPSLQILFQLKEIKSLDNEDIRTIKQLISNQDTENLRRTVNRSMALKGFLISDIDNELSTTEYLDLDTLLGEAVEETPIERNGLDNYWEEIPDFFIDKTIYVTDPATFQTYCGEIASCRKLNGNWIFQLRDRTEIKVLANKHVNIGKKTPYPFWRALTTIFERDSSLLIEKVNPEAPSPLIATGTYLLGGTKNIERMFRDSYRSTQLLYPATGEVAYQFDAYYTDNNPQKPYEIIISEPTPATDNLEVKARVTTDQLNESLNIIEVHSSEINSINQENYGKKILIKNEIDENKIKLARLLLIEKEKDRIRDDLRLPENQVAYDALLDDLVRQEFRRGNIALLSAQAPLFAARIQALIQKYANDLQMAVDADELLKDLVIEANYANLVADLIDRTQSVSISRTMKLMNDAFQHIERLSGKEIIFFMGNTGSGKSTAVNYFLGTPLKSFKNAVGDNVVDVDDNQIDNRSSLPKIGQSIGNSETLYTQAYPLKNSPNMLGDCPGFKENRGKDYELCTNLSIDRAIQEASSVKSIVVTIPIHSFLDEKGNAIIDLVETIKERFPRTFNADSIKESAHVYILITKSQQTLPDTVSRLLDGTRLQVLFTASQERLADLLKRRQEGARIDDAEIENIQRRSRIWQCLRSMQSNGQLDVIDIKNKRAGQRLMQKYAKSGSIDKNLYVPLMQGASMRLKFGQHVEMATNTWTNHIFKEYLELIPEAILATEGRIAQRNQRIEQLEQSKIDRQNRVAAIVVNQAALQALIAQLVAAQANPAGLIGNLRDELQRAVNQTNNQARNRIQDEIQRSNRAIQDETDIKNNIDNRINALQQSIRNKEQRIQALQQEIVVLEGGTTPVPLYREHFESNQVLILQNWRTGAWQECYDQFRAPRDGDYAGATQNVIAGEYRGAMSHMAYIEKDYKIVPTDPALKAAFAATNTGGQYIATLSGRKFALDMARKVSDTGLKVLYPFTTTWDGDGIPEINITHTVPNTEYNSATVRNKNGEINILRNQLAQERLELNGGGAIRGKNQERVESEQRLAQLEIQKANQERQLNELNNNAALEQLGEMVRQKRGEDQNLTREKARLENHTDIDAEILTLRQEIEAETKTKVGLQKRKRNFAIIIKLQEPTAKLLRDFANLIVADRGDDALNRNQTIEACRAYIQVYDDHMDEIRALCMSELAV